MAQGRYENKRRKKRSGGNGIIVLLAALLLVLAAMLFVKSCAGEDTKSTGVGTNADTTGTSSAATTETTETTGPTEPYIVSTASVGVTGDILMHGPVIQAAATGSGYDFNDNYEYIKDYYQQYDFMVANLEVTLGGPEAGPYKGYPTFNCPDDVIDALKNAGVDMILTANNHTYDTGSKGMMRTQQVISEKGLLHLGTRETTDVSAYTVQDINGIKVGMVCYTYETGKTSDGRKTLNGIALSSEASALVSSFDYNDLPGFYSEVESKLQAMEAEGADATMVYIHWGNEYQLAPNQTQKNIAQQLCELGVDVIVGGHPHVIQPFDTLTSSTGSKTYCIYSVGNALSNQNRTSLAETTSNARYTEDGMIFGVAFEKWNDGTVNISEISILPTWVNKEWKDKNVYNIIPLDTAVPVWNCYDVGNESRTYESYARTMSLVGEGLNACREVLGLPTAPLTFGEDNSN